MEPPAKVSGAKRRKLETDEIRYDTNGRQLCPFFLKVGKCTFKTCEDSHELPTDEVAAIRTRHLQYKQEERERKRVESLQIVPSPGAASKLKGWAFFREALKSPRFVAAPMVNMSMLPWRLLCRRHGADLCYTPMFHSENFLKPGYRAIHFTTCPSDRPLIVQFCGNQPDVLLRAAKYVETECDAVDLNLGCPQTIARQGNYGAFLADGDWALISSLVRTLDENLAVPVTCKIRVFDDLQRTIDYARMLEASGAQMLTVHGRTRQQKGPLTGLADWAKIRAVREAVNIPVISNGNIRTHEDALNCLVTNGVPGVMSAEGILENPALFEPGQHSNFDLTREYLAQFRSFPTSFHLRHPLLPSFGQQLCAEYPHRIMFTKGHVHRLLRAAVKARGIEVSNELEHELSQEVGKCTEIAQLLAYTNALDVKTQAPEHPPNGSLSYHY